MHDTAKRRISYLRVSVTDRCNLRCLYCMPPEGIAKKSHSDILSLEDLARIIRVSTSFGVEKLRLTGGEPLLRKNLVSLIDDVSNIGTIKDIAITTNALALAPVAKDLKDAGLMRINVSLDTLNQDIFSSITRGGKLKDVLNGLSAAREAGLSPIKINTVLIGGVNDDEIEALTSLVTDGYADELRFIELMPIGQAAAWAKDRFVSNEVVKKKLGLIPIKDQKTGDVAELYTLPGTDAVIGLINPVSHRFCNECNRLRITADGNIKPCLLTDQEINLKAALQYDGDEAIYDAFVKAVNLKGIGNHLLEENNSPIKRDMFRIGG